MLLRVLLIMFGVCCLFACAPQSDESHRAQNIGVFTTITNHNQVFPAGTLFSWSQETTRVHNDPLFGDVDLNKILHESIEAEILSRSHRIGSRGGEYRVSYVAALERALSDDEIDKAFGINPGLPSQDRSGQSYEKGTIIIDISDPIEKKSLWRSAMQGYVTLNLSEESRRERVRRVVERMFRRFPPAK